MWPASRQSAATAVLFSDLDGRVFCAVSVVDSVYLTAECLFSCESVAVLAVANLARHMIFKLLNFKLYLFYNNNTWLQIGHKVILLGGE